MVTLNNTYRQISNQTINCWGRFNMSIEQVKPSGIAFDDNKHNEKSVRLRLKDDDISV